MIRIILCEGETDATLLGYYLNSTAGWSYSKRPQYLNLQFSLQDNKCVLPYVNEQGEELFICGVGGKDGFRSFFETYLYNLIIKSHREEREFRIAVVTDRDKADIYKIEKDIAEQFSAIQCKVLNDCWTRNVFVNSFEQRCLADFLLVVIPKEKAGALENLLMDSLSENEYDANVVEKCKGFVVESIEEIDKYVSTERLIIKAQLGVALSIMNPERIFSLFDEYIKSVPWEHSRVLKECFEKIIEI